MAHLLGGQVTYLNVIKGTREIVRITSSVLSRDQTSVQELGGHFDKLLVGQFCLRRRT